MKKGYKAFLNLIIIVFVLAIVGIVGFLAYDYISNMILKSEAEAAVDEFEKMILEQGPIVVEVEDENIETGTEQNIDNSNNNNNNNSNTNNGSGSNKNSGRTTSSSSTSSSTNKTVKYKTYNIVGTIQIPKTKIKYPIVDIITPDTVAAAVTQIYGVGLNKVGNTVLVAHNRRNGTFFSNNKKLVNGDKIYITDSYGTTIEYTIYNVYTASETDFSYATRDTKGKREISLSTCTDDGNKRLVIWAKE